MALTARQRFWFLWILLLAIKLWIASRLPLFGDEAWYWLESRHLAWAYSDLPGLTAWLIRIGTLVGGDTLLGVRWPFLAIGALLPWLVVRTAARTFDEAMAWRAGVWALLLPLLGGLGLLALPDVPLTLAAMLCLRACLALRQRVDRASVCLLALGLALGALSHYRFVLLIVAGAAALLADGAGRRALRHPAVLAAVCVGAAAWWPLLHWNLSHANAGLAFQFDDRHPWQLHAGGVSFVATQVLLLGPLLLVGFAASIRLAWRRRRAGAEGPWPLLLVSALVPMLVYGALSFVADRERVSFHWLLQAYLPLVLITPLAIARWARGWRIAAYATTALLLAGLLAYLVIAATPAWRAALAHSRWYPDNFAGWDEIAQVLRETPPADDAPLLADNFMLGAQLAFALHRPDLAILDHPLNRKHGRAVQLALWRQVPDADALRTQPWTLVVEDSAVRMRERLDHYRTLCERIGPLAPLHAVNVDHGRKRFLRVDVPAPHAGGCVAPALAWIDAPAVDATVPRRFAVRGWAFKDGDGVAHVDVLLDGLVVARAEYGASMPRVAAYWRSTDTAHPDVGFSAEIDASAAAPGAHWLGLRITSRTGAVEDWPEQRIVLE